MLKIALLQCDQVDSRLHQHSGGDYPEMFARLLRTADVDFSMDTFDVRAGALPDAKDYQHYLITGSRQSVTQHTDWMIELIAFLTKVIAEGSKVVGICFGHQLLAHVLGGEVSPSPKGWGVGIHTITILKHFPWMQPKMQQCNLVFSHEDQVMRLPTACHVAATSPHCDIQMFVKGDNVLAMQGHPEMLTTHSRALFRHVYPKVIDEADLAQSQSTLDQLSNDGDNIAHWIMNFYRQ